MTILVVDVGTSGVRATVVGPDAESGPTHYREVLPTSPVPMFVEFDPAAMAAAALEVAQAAIDASGPVEAVGIANQRASTILWDRATGEPLGPGVSWQDLRTAGVCLALRERGFRLAPNESATKLAFLLDMADADRSRDLCFGTVDTWVAWTLSQGSVHVTDPSNAGLTGLLHLDGTGWNPAVMDELRIPAGLLPALVDSSGIVGEATALPGAPPIAGLAGDQQASLLGQGCTRPGMAKLTFGTGGMLDLCLAERPAYARRGPQGSFPIVAWSLDGAITWGLEAVMLSAGQAVAWLRDDLGILGDVAESEAVAGSCRDTNGVWFVPALQGLGAPVWDFGARGTLLGLTRGTGRPEIVRAVLEGIAHRAVDLVEVAESDGDVGIHELRVDGGMTANSVFLQALADASQRPVEVSRVREATTLGAAFLAGLAVGVWADLDEWSAMWKPDRVITPARRLDRNRWLDARSRATEWVPELSALEFF
ncbi:MAG: glycerol kinase [Actinobacteria bacterium]|nr:glycerol kinase [Actinomycetota bacterium]